MDEPEDKLPNPEPVSELPMLLRRFVDAIERMGPPKGPAMPPVTMTTPETQSIELPQRPKQDDAVPTVSIPPRNPATPPMVPRPGDAMMPGRPAPPAGLPPISTPPRTDAPDVPDISLPRQTANAGNIHIEASEGKQQPSVFGQAAITLQHISNMASDYGVQMPSLHAMGSWAKIASKSAGDMHTRGEGLRQRGIGSDASGDIVTILRSIENNTQRESHGGDDTGGGGGEIARNDLKDSIDSLKEAIDSLKDVVKESGGSKSNPAGGPTPSFRPTPSPSGGRPRSAQAQPLGTGAGLQAISAVAKAFTL